MSGLPPPPPDPAPGWDHGPAPSTGAPYGTPLPGIPPEPAIPSWRRASVGWVVLHLAIGVAIWFGMLFVSTLVAILLGRTYAGAVENDQTVGSWSLLMFLGSITGWMLFVYLRTSTLVRWLVFAAVAGLPALGMTVVLLDRLPRA